MSEGVRGVLIGHGGMPEGMVDAVRHITYKRGSSIIRKRERSIPIDHEEDFDEDDESENGH